MNEHRRSLSSTTVVLGILTAIVLSLSSLSTVSLTSISTLSSAFAQTTPPTCEGRTATIIGTSRGETIVGTSGNDVIAALAGNDIVQGNAGDDLICGGSGNDQLNGGDGNDRMIGESGDDELNGDSGTDQLVGSSGTDKANGGAGSDTCNAETETSCDEPLADTISPVLTVPDGITVQATSANGVVVAFSVSAKDNVDGTATLHEDNTLTQDNVGGDIRISCTPSSGSAFRVGDTTVNCTATDAAGNAATKSFTVTVTPLPDTIPPTLTVPDDITIKATSAAGAVVTFEVSAEDNVDGTATLNQGNTLIQDGVGGSITISCTPSSGSAFRVGDTTVNCTATDAAGNAATPASFTVTVNPITCQGVAATIVGTNGIDDLLGTEGRDVIALLDGDDLIQGLGGNDLICGDGGNDRQLLGGDGDDEMHGGDGNDNYMLGQTGNDRLFGEAGNDYVIDEVSGDDFLDGGAGDDVVDSDDNVVNNDSIDGGSGTDTCISDPDPEVNCELD